MRVMLANGWHAFRLNVQMWPLLFLFKLGLALVISIPVLITVQAELDHSLYSTPLLKAWSIPVLGELMLHRPFAFSALIITLGVFALLVLLLKQLLNGGIYTAFLSGRRSDTREFFAQSGRHFAMHIRITGIMAFAYLLLIGIGMFVASAAGKIVEGVAPQASAVGSIVWISVVGMFIILGTVYSDVLRVTATAKGQAIIRPSIRSAFDFYRVNGVRLVGTYLLLYVPFVVVWMAVEKSALAVTGGLGNGVAVLLEMILFQCCSLIRTGQSLLFTASVARLYRAGEPVPVNPESGEVALDGATVLP